MLQLDLSQVGSDSLLLLTVIASKVHPKRVLITRTPTSQAPSNPKPTDQLPPTVPSSKPRVLVIGNSMVRNTGPYLSKKLKNVETCVYTTSGYTLDRAITEVPELVKNFTKSDTIVLCLGTVDVDQNEVAEIASKYYILVGKLKILAPECHILISAIAYRLHKNSEPLNVKTDSVNSALRLLCTSDSQCIFVDVNPSATVENYFKDGLHFNYRGRHIFEEFLVNRITQVINFPLLANQPSR